MQKDNKIIVIISLITVAIIGLGIYFLTRPQKSSDPTSLPTANQNLLVRDNSASQTAPNQQAVLVEFGDFQCPACSAYYPIVKQVVDEKKDTLSFVFRHFPLSQHPNARPAAYAFEAAGNQGKYWEMFDVLYSKQAEWSDEKNPENIFINYAQQMGLDIDKFTSDMKSDSVANKVNADYADGLALKVNSTPSYFLNGRLVTMPGSYEAVKNLVDEAISNSPLVEATQQPDYHAHFDLKVVLSGKSIDFTNSKYQSSKDNELNENIHFHDGNGTVVHIHKEGVTLGELFESLKMKFESGCFTTDDGKKYCQDSEFGSTTLELYVNGNKNNDFQNYVPQDLDRILIIYGTENKTELQKQIDSVTDLSCIYSEKCPERGKPPTEECVGGIGTTCVEE